MKKVIFAIALAAIILTACGGKQTDNTSNEQKPDSIAATAQAEKPGSAYFPVIDRYLVDVIGKQFAKAEHCVPIYSIVGIDESKPDDILVWGDFWVFNYNLAGDTLKTVSGGSHPGLMHIRKTDNGYEVTAFDQVEDGANNLPSAKRIFGDKYDAFHAINSDAEAREKLRAEVLAEYVKKQGLSATMYQDYGWPAQKLP